MTCIIERILIRELARYCYNFYNFFYNTEIFFFQNKYYENFKKFIFTYSIQGNYSSS